MTRMLSILLFASLPLSACAPAADAPASGVATTPAPVAPVAPVATTAEAPATTDAEAPKPMHANASIAGAIRDGNRPPPALRVCAHPVAGGVPTCIDSPPGASDYRIEVAPGRYFLMGWVQAGELQLIAHASQIRCIRAPCPPDTLVELSLAPGEALAGIDLTAGAAEPPPAADG